MIDNKPNTTAPPTNTVKAKQSMAMPSPANSSKFHLGVLRRRNSAVRQVRPALNHAFSQSDKVLDDP